MTDEEAKKDIGDRLADIDEKLAKPELQKQVEEELVEVEEKLVEVEEKLKEVESSLKEMNNDIRAISNIPTHDDLPEDQRKVLTSSLTNLNEEKRYLMEKKFLMEKKKFLMWKKKFLMEKKAKREQEKKKKEKFLREEKARREQEKKEKKQRMENITSFKDAKEFIEENNLHLRETPNPLTEEGLLLKTELRHRDISIATVLKSAEYKLVNFSSVDTESHPYLTCFGAPGTGKSRLAQEVGKSFRDIDTRHDKESYPNLAKLANDVLCIHLSFSSNTKMEMKETNVQGALSRRLLSSAFNLDWEHSERFRGMKFFDSLTLVLHFHRLHHAPDAPLTIVYVAIDNIEGVYDNFGEDGLRALTDTVGMRMIRPPAGMLFVSLLTGTIRAPVRNTLVTAFHPSTEVDVPLLPLEESLKLVADAGVRRELVYNDHTLGRIIASTGGVPRMLEWLADYLCNVGEDMAGLEDHLQAAYMNVYGTNDNKDIKAKCIEMSILRERVLLAGRRVLPDCRVSYSDLERSGDIFLDPVRYGYLVVMPLIAIRACAADGVHIIPPNMLKVTANDDTWTNFEKLTAFYHALLCSMFSRRYAAEGGLVEVTEFFFGALISEDLNAAKLVLPSRHYGVVQSDRRFPETKHSYEGIMGSKKYKEGDVILNAKGAKTDIVIASRMATYKGLGFKFEEVKTMLLLHCKHTTGGTALSVEDIEQDWKQGLASIEAGKKDASCKDLGWKNAVQVIMSNSELSSDESKVVVKGKRCIVVSANQVREFYSPTFSPFVQLLRPQHWPQLPPQGRQFSTFSPACGLGRRAASTWPRLVQIFRRLK